MFYWITQLSMDFICECFLCVMDLVLYRFEYLIVVGLCFEIGRYMPLSDFSIVTDY